jgi:hypothetical protein
MKLLPLKTGAMGLAAGLALVLAGAAQGQELKNSYKHSELKREQEMFKTYLRASGVELSDAKDRLFNKGTCDLAAAATVAAMAEKDASRLSQKGHLERVRRVTGGVLVTAVANAKELNDSYLPILSLSNEAENNIRTFLGSLEKQCPEAMWMIRAYQSEVQRLENDPNAPDKLMNIAQGMKNGMGNGGKVNPQFDTVGRFLNNPSDPQARADFIKSLIDAGYSPDDAKALADAIAAHDWDKVYDILSRYPGQTSQDLWKRLQQTLGAPNRSLPGTGSPGSGSPTVRPGFSGGANSSPQDGVIG